MSNKDTRKIRYGMVGGGHGAFIGAVHRTAARLDNNFELVCGVFSNDARRSKEYGVQLALPQARCYADYQSMFAQEAALTEADRMQCVVIVTPNHLHFPVASAAIQNGFDVISEKPASFNLDECKQLAALLEKHKSHYVLSHPYASYPMVLEARNRVASGELGRLRKIIVEYTQGWLSGPVEHEGNRQASWRTDPQKAGASCCIGDIGVHAFNLAEFVSGEEVKKLNATLHTIVAGRKLDDDGIVLLNFSNGASGFIFASQVCVGEENNLRLRLYGDKASLDWRQEEPNSLWLKYADKPATLLRTAGPAINESTSSALRLPAGHPEGYIEAFGNLYSASASLLRTGNKNSLNGSACPGIYEALRGMAFIETTVASNQQGNVWLNMPAFKRGNL